MSDLNEKVLAKVKECLSQALGVENDEIGLDSSLTRDLGAESIDFLDIVFRLEQSFGIKIPRGDLFPEQFMSSANFVKAGKVTPEGIAELKKKFTYTDFTVFEKDPVVTKLIDTFTVKSLVGYLSGRLASENVKV